MRYFDLSLKEWSAVFHTINFYKDLVATPLRIPSRLSTIRLGIFCFSKNFKIMNNNTVTVNETVIPIFQDRNESYIAIKPICEAIGVNFRSQFNKLKEDPLLSSVVALRATTGSDGKRYEMQTMPFRYVFGWLFKIDSRNVKPEIKDSIIRYQWECYDILYDSVTSRMKILKERAGYNSEIAKLEKELQDDERYKRIQELKSLSKNATQRMNSLDKDAVQGELDL